MNLLQVSKFKTLVYILTNNIFINLIKILFHFDRVKTKKQWINFKYNSNKTLRENVGFSHRKDVDEAIEKAHIDLQFTAKSYLNDNEENHILDIGCGIGLYLKDFNKSFNLTGIDISTEMITVAKEQIPYTIFIIDNYLKTEFNNKFNLIYSISSLEYVPRSELNIYFKKIYNELDKNGIVFIHYPHALCLKDLFYPNLFYINYSPNLIEKTASKYFKIISHKHAFDDKKVKYYDKNHYVFKNSYLLIAQKKQND